METLWFVLLTTIAVNPVTLDGENHIPGDVIQSFLIGAAETEKNCEAGGKILAEQLNEIGGGKTYTTSGCVELDRSIGEEQGFSPMVEIPG